MYFAPLLLSLTLILTKNSSTETLLPASQNSSELRKPSNSCYLNSHSWPSFTNQLWRAFLTTWCLLELKPDFFGFRRLSSLQKEHLWSFLDSFLEWKFWLLSWWSYSLLLSTAQCLSFTQDFMSPDGGSFFTIFISSYFDFLMY